MKFGAWDYILKPIHDYSILELSVKRVLERKRLLEENKQYRQHLEKEVAIRTQDLNKSTLKFETLFNLAADAILIHDTQGNIIDINQKAIRYSGLEREQILKSTIFDLFTETEEDVLKKYMADLNNGKHILFESYMKSGDSAVIPVEVSASLITMDNSLQIMAVARDITERKKAEEERRELEKQIVAAQKMELLGLLASGVAHDFNNVLSALTGYTVLLRSKMKQGSAEEEYLKKINGIIAMGQNVARRITTFVKK
jgi:PAS domain S-box-containing protein